MKILRDELTPTGLRVIVGAIIEQRLAEKPVELVIDGDGRIARGKCGCSFHFKNGLRKGPCRHLQVLRNRHLATAPASFLDQWYTSFWN